MAVPGEKVEIVPSKDIRLTHVPEFPACKTIDIANYFDSNVASTKQIWFTFYRLKNLGVSLYVVDKNKALKRPLKVRSL